MNYKVLKTNKFSFGDFSLIPIRQEDRYQIMNWRNDQIYHLRQSEPLTREKQDWYFENVVSNLFQQDYPEQILFSFLKGETCIGYGGLVHINWVDKNAEISFIMESKLEENFFHENWTIYLKLISKVAFEELNFNKIYTYAYDLRPHLFKCLEQNNFFFEARLKRHILFEDSFYDVLIHSKWKERISLREASMDDIEDTFKWANNPAVRKYSFNQKKISFETHKTWFQDKLKDVDCFYYIAFFGSQKVGSFRFDVDNEKGIISFLLDSHFHGMGLGKELLQKGVEKIKKDLNKAIKMVGYVFADNKASIFLFEKFGFHKTKQKDGILEYTLGL